jgi:acyl carrier protein
MIYEIIKDSVSHYIRRDYTDTTNLLGITSVRNIIYILMDIENKIGIKIDDSFISEMKEFTIENLAKLIPNYLI